ncbi:class II aldolase/adducin family protein [Methylocaldum sp. MU1018]
MNDLDQKQDKEGVVKYRLNYTAAPPADPEVVAELNAWRTILYRLGLIGLDSRRYGGLAYGNVSIRCGATGFLISGTRTGGLPALSNEHYSRVTGFDLERNLIVAEGPVPPSSEALTHAAVYRSAGEAGCVLHVHSPEIWEKAGALGIPVTDRQVGYGTPEMADEVGRLIRASKGPVIAMGGHEDGIIAFGGSVESAAINLIRSLARASA